MRQTNANDDMSPDGERSIDAALVSTAGIGRGRSRSRERQAGGAGEGRRHEPSGLFLGHNMPPDVEVLDYGLPASVPNWPELSGEVIGFRPAEAVGLAAAWFPASDGLAEVEAPNNLDQYVPLGGGQAVDVTSGEIVRLVSTVETHPLRAVHERKIRRRLVIAGGKVAVECDHFDRTEKRLEAIEAALALDAMLDDLDGDWDAVPTTACQNGDAMSEHTNDDEELYGRVVWEFSRKSRQRLRQRVAEADWYTALQQPGVRIGMITLTYPGDWERYGPKPQRNHRPPSRPGETNHPSPRLLTRILLGPRVPTPRRTTLPPRRSMANPHRRQNRYGPGCPKPGTTSSARATRNTSTPAPESTGPKASKHPTPIVSPPTSRPTQQAKAAKNTNTTHQNDGANDNGSAGRHWGYRGVELTRSEVALTRDQMVEAQRFLRRYIASQKRARRTKGRTGDRPRAVNRRWKLNSLVGLDTGFTLLTNDGPALAVALARAIDHTEQEETTWPPGQTRPLP